MITGPELLTVGDKVAAIAAARGRAITLTELTEEQAVAQRRAAGHLDDVIGFLVASRAVRAVRETASAAAPHSVSARCRSQSAADVPRAPDATGRSDNGGFLRRPRAGCRRRGRQGRADRSGAAAAPLRGGGVCGGSRAGPRVGSRPG